jgi:hypothetical protein
MTATGKHWATRNTRILDTAPPSVSTADSVQQLPHQAPWLSLTDFSFVRVAQIGIPLHNLGKPMRDERQALGVAADRAVGRAPGAPSEPGLIGRLMPDGPSPLPGEASAIQTS